MFPVIHKKKTLSRYRVGHVSSEGIAEVWFQSTRKRAGSKAGGKGSAQEIIGLVVGSSRLALCWLDAGGRHLRWAKSVSLEPTDDWARVLGDCVREQNLKGLDCHVVLGGDDYKLLPVEVPEVPAAEVDQALLWSLRDMLDAPPPEMVVQSFPFASGLNRPGRHMRHAVAARRKRIQALVDGVLEAGLVLQSIDIPELALRNLADCLPERDQGVCMVSKSARSVSINLYRANELYLARQLAGSANLDDALHPLTAPRLADQLGLDLLRTLDYYDSQLQQRPPAAICLQPMPGDTSTLVQTLSDTLRLPVRQLRFDELVKSDQPLSAELQADCVLALGAALRGVAA
jgi:MSHA biogenesis protein MshI